jgi:hypothetical protein
MKTIKRMYIYIHENKNQGNAYLMPKSFSGFSKFPILSERLLFRRDQRWDHPQRWNDSNCRPGWASICQLCIFSMTRAAINRPRHANCPIRFSQTGDGNPAPAHSGCMPQKRPYMAACLSRYCCINHSVSSREYVGAKTTHSACVLHHSGRRSVTLCT